MYDAAHNVTGADPPVGASVGGAAVTIAGTAFADSPALACRFGVAVGAATYDNAGQLRCTAPSLADAAGHFAHLDASGAAGADLAAALPDGAALVGGAAAVGELLHLTSPSRNVGGALLLPGHNPRLLAAAGGPDGAPPAFRATFDVHVVGGGGETAAGARWSPATAFLLVRPPRRRGGRAPRRARRRRRRARLIPHARTAPGGSGWGERVAVSFGARCFASGGLAVAAAARRRCAALASRR